MFMNIVFLHLIVKSTLPFPYGPIITNSIYILIFSSTLNVETILLNTAYTNLHRSISLRPSIVPVTFKNNLMFFTARLIASSYNEISDSVDSFN